MTYYLSWKACEKQSNEKVVHFPNKEMIEYYVANGGPNPFTLTAILTAPSDEVCMNFVLNTGDRTSQI